MLASHGTFHHVYDFPRFEFPFGLHVDLPAIGGFQITKFMVLQVVAILITLWIFRGLVSRIQGGKVASGWFWNFWEMLALYIRDEVVRPIIGDPHAHGHDDHSPAGREEFAAAHGTHLPVAAHARDVAPEHAAPLHGHQHPLGEALYVEATGASSHAINGGHPADKYLPFIWSAFFYILICNLLGAVPFLGSATGSIAVTGALAVTAFVATYIYGAQIHGFAGFWPALVPGIDAPGILKPILVVMMFGIEVLGFFIKHGVLAVRLFANIMGGHTVLGVILAFIAQVSHSGMWWVVTPGSLAGQIGVGLLELLVAFIQAYVFAFLATIFIGMVLHEH